VSNFYPDLIEKLPQANIPIEGVTARLLQSEHGQLIFFDIPQGAKVPEHAHGDQWGTVLDGTLELTIGGEAKTYHKGDSYTIPAGVLHEATFPTRCRIIDLFADTDRYAAKT